MHTINSLCRFFTAHFGKPWTITLLTNGWEDDGGSVLHRKADPQTIKKEYGDRMVAEWSVNNDNGNFVANVILL